MKEILKASLLWNHDMKFLLLRESLLLSAILCWFVTRGVLFAKKKSRCQRVTNSVCLSRVHAGYNSTQFPNFMEHRSQHEASEEMLHYMPLIKVGCSRALPTLLCALYIPVCDVSFNALIPPCRELCEHTRDGCANLMSQFGYTWRFDCTRYPREGRGKICIGGKQHQGKKGKVKQRKGWTTGDENDTIRLRCTRGRKILVRKIRHSSDSRCCLKATSAVLSAMCNGKTKCDVTVGPSSLGGHCDARTGKLSIRHRCVQVVKTVACDIS